MSESFILQTYPFREADLVVSFFTRDQGKLRGVARRARRAQGSFGSGLERLSCPIVIAVALVTATAAIACLIPARRATRIDPMQALRQE